MHIKIFVFSLGGWWRVKGAWARRGRGRVKMQAPISLQFYCFYSNTQISEQHPHTHSQAIHIPMALSSHSLALSLQLLLALLLLCFLLTSFHETFNGWRLGGREKEKLVLAEKWNTNGSGRQQNSSDPFQNRLISIGTADCSINRLFN